MAEHGEWSRKGATLSDVTACKEYGVDSDFIVKGINAGKLEYREGAIHGNPYIRLLRRQLEATSPRSSATIICLAGKRGPSCGKSLGQWPSCASGWMSLRQEEQ